MDSREFMLHLGEKTDCPRTLTEYDFIQFSRSFSAEEIASSYRSVVSLTKETMQPVLDIVRQGIFTTTVDAKNYADVQALMNIIMYPYTSQLIEDFPERFQKVFGDDLSDSQLFSLVGSRMWNNTAIRFCHYVAAMTTSRNEEDWLAPQDILPDFTQPEYQTPESKLDKIIDMLTLTHEEAVRRVSGLSLEEYKALKTVSLVQYHSIAQAVGAYVGRNSIYGILTNKNNDPERENDFVADEATWDSTSRHRCPAEDYVRTYFEGIGAFLQENRAWVLSQMKS